MQRFNSYIIRPEGDNSPAFCPKCGQDKPISEYYRHSVRGDNAIRYRPYCKNCRKAGPRAIWSRPVHAEIIKSGRQVCKHCNTEKSIEEFYANGCFKDGVKKYRSTCKSCVLEKSAEKSSAIYKTKAQKRSSSPKNFISGVLNHAVRRKRHLGCDIDLIYLMNLYEKQEGKCAISGVEMTYMAGFGRTSTNISIDRIDSSKGYLRGNVQFVCDVVNRMKQDMAQKELYDWCEKILRFANGKLQNTRLV